MQSQQQICKGRFAGATTSYESDCLTRLDFEIDVLKRVFVRARWITKRNVLKLNLAIDTRQSQPLLFVYVLWACIEYVVQSFKANTDFLKLTPKIYDTQNW